VVVDAVPSSGTVWAPMALKLPLIAAAHGIRTEKHLRSMRQHGIKLVLLQHVAQGLLLAVYQVWVMVLANVVTVIIVAGLHVLADRRSRLAAHLTLVEAFVHVPLASVLLGMDAGYAYFYLPAACAGLLHFPFRDRFAWAWPMVMAFVGAVALHLAELNGYEAVIHANYLAITILFYMNAVGSILLMVVSVGYFALAVDRAHMETEEQRVLSERLLQNTLPPSVAERLKAGATYIADSVPAATVLFADLVGFTPLSNRLEKEELIALLNTIFSEFDLIADRHELEKIKTIGDAYLVVGGIPTPLDDHCVRVALMALDMRAAVARMSDELDVPLEVRIGCHTGPVIAGVIGERKFSYDLWGDTVNIASRMESHGEAGEIQVTEEVAAELGDRFVLEERGEIDVKGKGKMRTFYLRGAAQVETAADS